MKFWLLKSEPDVWSFSQQRKAGSKGVAWDGVRNYQAANNLKEMKVGDLCFFYHSNIGKAVQVRFIEEFSSPITLEIIKKTKTISHLPLIKQSRLSVMPIDYKSWKIIYKMGKIKKN